jgi:hypothetical protein
MTTTAAASVTTLSFGGSAAAEAQMPWNVLFQRADEPYLLERESEREKGLCLLQLSAMDRLRAKGRLIKRYRMTLRLRDCWERKPLLRERETRGGDNAEASTVHLYGKLANLLYWATSPLPHHPLGTRAKNSSGGETATQATLSQT